MILGKPTRKDVHLNKTVDHGHLELWMCWLEEIHCRADGDLDRLGFEADI